MEIYFIKQRSNISVIVDIFIMDIYNTHNHL